MTDIQRKTVRGPIQLGEIHSSGRSIANLEGKNYYIDFGIPGEEVTFLLHRKKLGFRLGEVVDVVTPSAHRVEPFCMHHQQCGGCPWQHINYDYQLVLKHTILCNALKHYGIETPDVPAVIPSPGIHYYRNRVEYTFSANPLPDPRHTGPNNTGLALGFHRYAEPGQVIDIRECFLQQQPSRAICAFVKSYAIEQGLEFYNHELKTGFLRSISIRTNRAGEVQVVVGFNTDKQAEREQLLRKLQQEFPAIVSLCWTIHPSHAHSQLQGEIHSFGNTEPYTHKILRGNRFRIHAASFFQPNARQAEKIFETATQWSQLTGRENVYDLYAGVGTIALFLAAGARHVTGIEGSEYAVEDARANALMNGISNTTFITGDVLETFKPGFLHEHGKPDLIALDPPRSGTLIEIKKTINGSGARKVLYISCNPVSLAFDLKQLSEAYNVVRIQPFDMVPHTHHLETLVMLEKKA